MHTIDITSLDSHARRQLAAELKGAAKAREAVLIRGAAGVWDHEPDASDSAADYHALALAVVGHPAPVALSVRGAVNGFGMALVAAADMVIASEDATFATGDGGAALLTGAYRLLESVVSRSFAASLAYTGRTLSRADAVAVGLVVDAPSDILDTPAAVAVKRAAIADVVAGLTQSLAYDGMLARTVRPF